MLSRSVSEVQGFFLQSLRKVYSQTAAKHMKLESVSM